MFGLNYKLLKLEEEGNPVYAGVVGAGNQGRGMINQMACMPGMRPAIISDIRLENAVSAYENAGLTREQFIVTNDLKEANEALKNGKFVVTEDFKLVAQAEGISTVVDATGVPEVGARLAVEAIRILHLFSCVPA